ncbi:MAG: STAS domain-containing protein [Oscillatoriales cyanobacterium SM2_2_1]|nr:STAS domain-containing protein [Oscillatoriales cyanobacterium SM2_2_1]
MANEIHVLTPGSKLDVTNAGQFRRQVSDLVLSKPKVLLIDLKNVTFMDSSGLGALVSALKTVRANGGEMALASIGENVQMLFDLTSMGKIFKIYHDRAAFESQFGSILEQ